MAQKKFSKRSSHPVTLLPVLMPVAFMRQFLSREHETEYRTCALIKNASKPRVYYMEVRKLEIINNLKCYWPLLRWYENPESNEIIISLSFRRNNDKLKLTENFDVERFYV